MFFNRLARLKRKLSQKDAHDKTDEVDAAQDEDSSAWFASTGISVGQVDVRSKNTLLLSQHHGFTSPHLGLSHKYALSVPANQYYMSPREAPQPPTPDGQSQVTQHSKARHARKSADNFARRYIEEFPRASISSPVPPPPQRAPLQGAPHSASQPTRTSFLPGNSFNHVAERTDNWVSGLGVPVPMKPSSLVTATPTSEDLWAMQPLKRTKTPPSYVTTAINRSRAGSNVSHEQADEMQEDLRMDGARAAREYAGLLGNLRSRAEERRELKRETGEHGAGK